MKARLLRRGVGIDMVAVERFRMLTAARKKHLLTKLFRPKEIEYCARYKDKGPHLAGIFAAKEAANKVLGASAKTFHDLEVRHARDGSPEIWYRNKRSSLSVSITHTDEIAAAVAQQI